MAFSNQVVRFLALVAKFLFLAPIIIMIEFFVVIALDFHRKTCFLVLDVYKAVFETPMGPPKISFVVLLNELVNNTSILREEVLVGKHQV